MSMQAFKITEQDAVELNTTATTLDEMTRELPQGFYTTFSTLSQGTKVFGLQAHLRRLYVPAREMGLKPAADERTLRARIASLIKENLPNESRVRVILTKDAGAIYLGIQYFEALSETIYLKGVGVITTQLVRKTPRRKDTGFISLTEFQRGQLGRNVFEVLLTQDGKILEGMTSNFYGIEGKSLVTAQRGVLPGITRKAILRLARGQGMSIDYRASGVDEKLDEAFLTSSSRGVVPIVSIDGRPVGEGQVGEWTKTLSKAYRAHLREKSESIV